MAPHYYSSIKEKHMTISDTHRQLLRTMLQFEIDNYINPKIKEINERRIARDDEINLIGAKNYLENRIKALAE